jgi:hypothetical protein
MAIMIVTLRRGNLPCQRLKWNKEIRRRAAFSLRRTCDDELWLKRSVARAEAVPMARRA